MERTVADLCLSSAATGGNVSLAEPHQDQNNNDAAAAHEAWRRKLHENARRAAERIGSFCPNSKPSQRAANKSAPSDPPLTPFRRSGRVPVPQKDTTDKVKTGRVMPRGRRGKPTKAKKQKKEVSETFYSVRRIAGEKTENGRLFYLIDWANDPVTGKSFDPTWVCF